MARRAFGLGAALAVAAGLAAAPAPTIAYPNLPLPVGQATAGLAPSVANLPSAPAAYAVVAGQLADGLALDPATGVISGTPATAGTFRARVQVLAGGAAATVDLVSVVIPPARGLSADRPALQFDRNGGVEQPWGAAGASWPEQQFWQNLDLINSSHVNEMRAAAAGLEAAGRVPVLGCVAWGYEYGAATGTGAPDNRALGGWKQWGAWMADPAHAKYQSTNWHGTPEPGYVTPLMPMDPADWPAEWTPPGGWVAPSGWVNGRPAATESYGAWLGARLAQLCLAIDCRGIYCADYVVGLEWGDAVDYNPRVIDDFAAWAGVTVPPGTVAERADFVQNNFKSAWWDFKCTRFLDFYGGVARSLLANGRTPLVGGQIGGLPMWTRGSGNDFRLYTQGPAGLPGRYWFFNVELQSDSLRPPPAYWFSSICMGATAAREPDMQLGGQMDATGGQGEFDRAVANAGHDAAWGLKQITHQWLSVGWTHVAGRDGAVRRAPVSFMRSYWDAGVTPQTELDLVLGHIPRHPFGPAFYYSVPIERSYETGNGKTGNSFWWALFQFERELAPVSVHRTGNARGLATGYYVSDAALDAIRPVDRPSGWIVYAPERLTSAERTKLEALAPIFDIDPTNGDAAGLQAAQLRARSPVHVAQAADQCLNCLAFVDQNNSVIILVSNSLDTAGAGTLVFNHVHDGVFDCNGLLGAANTRLTIAGSTGQLPIQVPARGNIVYEIPYLQWIGHETLTGAPVITAQPRPVTVAAGQPATFAILAEGATPLSYQWRHNGVALPGATTPTLTLPEAQSAQAGEYAVTVTNASGSVVSEPARLALLPGPVPQRLLGIATRAPVGTGGEIEIGGFVITGTRPKRVIIRAGGPSLAALGVPGALDDPVLTLFAGGTVLQQNDDWQSADAPAFAAVGLPAWPAGSRDAALLTTLPPGAYTAQVAGKNGSTGVALIEVYDADPDTSGGRLYGLATRSLVGTGGNIQIGGFVIEGDSPRRVLVRANGPALAGSGITAVLTDPTLTVFSGGTAILSNDDWDAALSADFAKVGLPAWNAGSKDAAIVATLAPGAYTAQVSGKNGATGVALIEIYEAP